MLNFHIQNYYLYFGLFRNIKIKEIYRTHKPFGKQQFMLSNYTLWKVYKKISWNLSYIRPPDCVKSLLAIMSCIYIFLRLGSNITTKINDVASFKLTDYKREFRNWLFTSDLKRFTTQCLSKYWQYKPQFATGGIMFV